ncbi:response regulator with CheY-like receiver domain and winged-helix DNA-binding domain [Schinkia azotoformans MEV2011]|uniref:Response regulator with CheY-like receiver domain and winged-helix DNA-binding domain n=1 Tax=Schinkia azotoformans MEV2011 TaxID=1348973 RepID=A0A072NMD3_SCHAZ|nr:response regulator transcription factor [Schinkia azotoformans]KEF38422.1 response regulator with CheY-like receiver domain and winged-helix DNA-binding domain [Schinkia azotoformans MEV2011]MEC1694164.1 response regulator transcription factor [Schinkia azotoformans]MEC1724830.1 response regulator transcription factor [Schinkia azotoformans]MEC1780910.1 response regulator transcription factor [Schinkia azotoformans]MED4330564.1 response regulator transcription factor [Schinkia azotoformans]
MVKKILVVDDEPAIITLLQYNLQQSGFEVSSAMDGEAGIKMVMEENPDIMILDLMLPKLDGIEVCKKLREDKIMIPILMLTAKGDEFDKILGLELGADDYMTKPFSPREVVARVKAILRRKPLIDTVENKQSKEGKIQVGDLKIFPERFEAYIGEERLDLTPKEFELLVYLSLHKGLVITRDQLLNDVWNYEYANDTRIVDVHISHLREKIERNSKKPVYIKTIRGVGYKLEEPK